MIYTYSMYIYVPESESMYQVLLDQGWVGFGSVCGKIPIKLRINSYNNTGCQYDITVQLGIIIWI